MSLNKQQKSIVESLDGYHLVIAGAGTGKTHTVIARVAYLLKNRRFSGNILLVTFTKKAAHEITERIKRIIGTNEEIPVTAGTFHSWCSRFLRKYAAFGNIKPNFTVMDEDDMVKCMQEALTNLGYKHKDSPVPKATTMNSIWSEARNKDISVADIIEKDYQKFVNVIDETSMVIEEYQSLKLKMNAMDFDDLLIKTEELLRGSKPLREYVNQQYPYVIVDEYQDVNKSQALIANHISEVSKNLMVVGDDAQSIYGFRGANIQFIRDFPLVHQNCMISKLEENYRSYQPILDIANLTLEKMDKAFKKNLFSEKTSPYKHVILKPLTDEWSQGQFMVQEVVRLISQGVNASDICILARGSRHTMSIEAEFLKNKISYVKYGGLSFHQHAHIKDAISILRASLSNVDTLAWRRSIGLLPGIGESTSSKIVSHVISGKNIYESPVKNKQKIEFDKLVQVIEKIKKSDVNAIYKIVKDFYEPLCEIVYDDSAKRIAELSIIDEMLKHQTSLSEAIESFTLDRPDKKQDNEGKSVIISTIHSAKGLEWEHVYVASCVSGRFPTVFCTNETELDEDRRLFYVATTRAKNKLTYLCPHIVTDNNGMVMPAYPSIFIEENKILSDLVKKS